MKEKDALKAQIQALTEEKNQLQSMLDDVLKENTAAAAAVPPSTNATHAQRKPYSVPAPAPALASAPFRIPNPSLLIMLQFTLSSFLLSYNVLISAFR